MNEQNNKSNIKKSNNLANVLYNWVIVISCAGVVYGGFFLLLGLFYMIISKDFGILALGIIILISSCIVALFLRGIVELIEQQEAIKNSITKNAET